MRDPTDPFYSEDMLEHSSEIEALIGEIKTILFTRQGDVLGAYTFGFNLEDNLFLFNLNETQLRTKLLDAIIYYCPDASNYSLDMTVQFFQGTVRDICLIDIFIDGQKTLGVLVK
jgi:hypothetical protein